MSRCRGTLLLVLCLASCAQTPQAEQIIEGPAIDVEKDLKPGMQREAVALLLGAPDRDEVPSRYEPHVIREWDYKTLGLHLCFHETKGLGYVSVDRRWVKAVHGYRYGDVLKPGEVDLEKESVLSHFKTDRWSDAYFFFDVVEVEQDGRKQKVAKVRSIVLEDEEIYGSWMPTIKFK
jgi:hypothetical protein